MTYRLKRRAQSCQEVALSRAGEPDDDVGFSRFQLCLGLCLHRTFVCQVHICFITFHFHVFPGRSWKNGAVSQNLCSRHLALHHPEIGICIVSGIAAATSVARFSHPFWGGLTHEQSCSLCVTVGSSSF